MEYILWYIIIFMIIFLVLFIWDFYIPSRKDTLGASKVHKFITRKYNLSMDKKRVRTLAKIIVLSNSFIISIPMTLILFINFNYFASLGISFIIFIILILIIYNLIGYCLKKKGW